MQVMAFDQFDTHLVGQKAVFVIGGIIDAGGEHGHHRRAGGGRGGAGGKAAVQQFGIIADRFDPVAGKEFGEHLQHRLAVFQHVADAGGGPGVILEHIEFIIAGAHQIDADDMGVDPAGGCHADHLRQEGRVAGDHFDRQASGADDFLPVIDIVQERIDRADPLFDPFGEARPFAPRNDPRDDVEGDQPFGRLGAPVDVEGDAGQAKHLFGLALFAAQTGRILAL